MATKTIELLLTENVYNLGIVGDVVRVRTGYARNFLLPREFATTPSEEKIAALAERRKVAERQLSELRSMRLSLVERLEGHEVTLERSCNDQGLLYGSISQKDISDALDEAGFAVKARDVRLAQSIKRIDSYEVVVKPDHDLEATIKVWVVSDRPLDLDDRDRDSRENQAAEATDENEPRIPEVPAEASFDA